MTFLLGFACGYLVGALGILGFYWYRKHQYDGVVKITKTPEGKIFSLELNRDPETLENEDDIHFKVEAPEAQFRE